jgi:hypothetical protein
MAQGKDGNCRDCNKDCGEAEITLDALSFHVRLLLNIVGAGEHITSARFSFKVRL